jgi:hypothetical protein
MEEERDAKQGKEDGLDVIPEQDLKAENDKEEDDALVTSKSALEMTLRNNKLTIEYLDDEQQRAMTEMHESLQATTSQVAELKQEKKGLFPHSQAQDVAIATLEDQTN